MIYRGGIVNVRTEPLGDQLAAAASVGATQITVYDTADFEETQGVLQIGDEVIGYASLDDETGVILLDDPLVSAYALDDPVLAHPLGTVTTAEVVVEEGGDPLSARVPHALVPMLPDGVRSGADEQEAVDLEKVDTEWVVTDVVGKTPVADASYTDPGTLPPDAITPPDPPAESPQPIVRAFSVLALDAEWDQEPGATEYDVFVSTASGFTADSSTYFGTVTATHVVITTDPTAGGARLTVQPYYVKTIARAVNPAGSAQAAPSLEGSATPRQASTEEISALYAYLGEVEASQIRSGVMDADVVIGGSIKTAGLDVSGNQVYPYWTADAQGARLYGPGGADDIRHSLPADATLPVRTSGISELDRLKTALSASLAGATVFEKGGSITFAAGIGPPSTEPYASSSWYSLLSTVASPSLLHGLIVFDATYFGTVRELSGDPTTDSSTFVKIDRTTYAGTDAWSLGVAGFSAYGGVTLFGGFLYFLGHYDADAPTRAGEWWVLKYSTAGVKQAAEWQWTVGSTAIQGSPGIGNWSTTQLVIAYQIGTPGGSQNAYLISRRTADTGAVVGSNFTSAATLSTASGVAKVDYGSFDYGTDRLMLFPHTPFGTNGATAAPWLAMTSTGATLTGTGDKFPLASTGPTVGVVFDGTRFVQLTRNGSVYPYSTIMWTSGSSLFWVSNTYRDADAGGTGTHETTEGPRASLTHLQRAHITVSVASVPDAGGADDPNTVSFYAARKSSAPLRTEMWLQAAPSPPAVDGGAVNARVSALATSGTNPPSTSNFPGATPTQAVTAAGELMWSGDGTSPWAPVGTIQMWLTGTVPTGWLKLDGSAVSRTTYSRLFTLWGTGFGVGDGSTTFNLPDFRSRFPIGVGTFAALGAHDSFAEASRTPSHTHNITGAVNHTHGAGTLTAGTNADRAAGGLGRATTAISGSTASDGAHDHGGSTGPGGGVSDFPFFAVNFIVKV